MIDNLAHLKYPIGLVHIPANITENDINKWIEVIEGFPNQIKHAVEGLPEIALEKQYRPNSWTIRQLIHHCADSHMNSYIRFKLALTESIPTVKPYDENLWAEMSDTKDCPISLSIKLLEGVHGRWAMLLKNMKASDFEKSFYHPESKEHISLKISLAKYAWHCQHHLAHIELAKTY